MDFTFEELEEAFKVFDVAQRGVFGKKEIRAVLKAVVSDFDACKMIEGASLTPSLGTPPICTSRLYRPLTASSIAAYALVCASLSTCHQKTCRQRDPRDGISSTPINEMYEIWGS